METTISVNEVKKELMKSKVNAKLSHYVSGNLYYTVELTDGVYQFPISTIEKVELKETNSKEICTFNREIGKYSKFEEKLCVKEDESSDYLEIKFDKLSSDLGTTSFYNEMRGSELNRWIVKAIEKNEFIKIS